MQWTTRHIVIAGTLAVGLVLSIAGCGGGSGDKARLRVMHASPDSSALNILVDGNTLASGLAFESSTGYTSESSGSRELQVETAGNTTPIIDQTLSLGSGTDTTVLLANYAVSMNAVTFQDDNSAPTSGNVKLRVINAAPALQPADMYVVPDGTDINSVAPVISNMSFESSSGYASLTAGTYRVWLTAPGQKFPFVDSGALTLNAGQIRTVVGLNTAFGAYSAVVLSDLN